MPHVAHVPCARRSQHLEAPKVVPAQHVAVGLHLCKKRHGLAQSASEQRCAQPCRIGCNDAVGRHTGSACPAGIRDGRLEAMASPTDALTPEGMDSPRADREGQRAVSRVRCAARARHRSRRGGRDRGQDVRRPTEQKLCEVRPMGRTLLKVNMNASSESWQRLHCRSACATALLMIASTDTSSHSDCFWNAFTSSVSFLRAAAAACTYYVP